jgi:hypothetical protein
MAFGSALRTKYCLAVGSSLFLIENRPNSERQILALRFRRSLWLFPNENLKTIDRIKKYN